MNEHLLRDALNKKFSYDFSSVPATKNLYGDVLDSFAMLGLIEVVNALREKPLSEEESILLLSSDSISIDHIFSFLRNF